MQHYFDIEDGKIVKAKNTDAHIRVFISPTEEERQIIQNLGIDVNDLDAALDPDEISRVEFTQHYTSIIWKQPFQDFFSLKAQFDVLSVGFFIHEDQLTMIMREHTIPFAERFFDRVYSVNDVVLKYFLYTTRQYLSHLKSIKQVTMRVETKLNMSLENKYFLQMFDMSESLIYYLNAIEGNGAVLAKLRANVSKIKFSQKQVNYLEDIIQDNSQSSRQASIYSTVLSGLMDARGTIINNNMNILLRNLTLINIIFLPLNLIASMGGMSEYTMMITEFGINWRLGYFLFAVGLVIIGTLVWISLKRYIGGDVEEVEENGNGIGAK
jgi:magnesium transporter